MLGLPLWCIPPLWYILCLHLWTWCPDLGTYNYPQSWSQDLLKTSIKSTSKYYWLPLHSYAKPSYRQCNKLLWNVFHLFNCLQCTDCMGWYWNPFYSVFTQIYCTISLHTICTHKTISSISDIAPSYLFLLLQSVHIPRWTSQDVHWCTHHSQYHKIFHICLEVCSCHICVHTARRSYASIVKAVKSVSMDTSGEVISSLL